MRSFTLYTVAAPWRLDGTWERLNRLLREAVRQKAGKHPQASAAIVDSQSVKRVERGAERGYDAGKKVTGRKRHLVVDTLGLVLIILVTSAQQVLQELYRRMQDSLRLQKVWADGGYRGPLIAWVQFVLGWTLEIVHKLGDQVGFQVLPKRWIVERTFAWLNRQRRLSKDYERLPETSQALIYVAMIRLMLKKLAHA